METLMDSVSGCYLVHTFSGSIYVVNLDDMWLLRRRASGVVGVEVSELRRDDEEIALVAVLDCTVLRRPIFLVDLGIGVLTVRRPTMVLSIEPVVGVTSGGER
jgi:hypothetical protein